jgi:hypothetical protein
MPSERLTGADVDALLFGTTSKSAAEEGGATAPGRPWRYPPWPRCDGCGFRDGAVTSCAVKGRVRSRRVWLCEWCYQRVPTEGVVSHA